MSTPLSEAQWKAKYSKWIAAFTAIFALFSIISSVMMTRNSGRAQGYTNESISLQNEVSNEWAYFQSRNIRASLTEILMEVKVAPDNKARLAEKQTELKEEKALSFSKAKVLEEKRDKKRALSRKYGAISRYFSNAAAFFQLATILFPLSLITITTAYIYIGFAFGFSGSVAFVYAITYYFVVV